MSAPIAESLFNSGIMGVAFTSLYIVFTLFYKWHLTGASVGFKGILILSVSALAVLFIGALNYILRVEFIFGSVQNFLGNIDSLVVPTPYLLSVINEPIFGPVALSLYWMSNYFLQGLFEFSFLVDHFDPGDFAHGAKQFFVVDKFLSIVGITSFDPYHLTAINPRPGRYQTVFGDVYMDFGVLGVIVQPCIIGFVFACAYLYRGVGKFWALVIYPFFQASIVSGFLINSLSGGRLYYLVACVIAIFFYYLSFGVRKRTIK
jgi:hypothetical protein